MKFIVMTNPAYENKFIEELLDSGLVPEMIVTESPFYTYHTNILKYIIKKALLILKYIQNYHKIQNYYSPYFLAKKKSIPFHNSANVNSEEFQKILKELEIDYVFTFGFKLLKENIFKAPKFGCINFHPSLLPLNRGATPSKWVVFNNQIKTGITFHYIDKGIDTGKIIEQYEIPLSGYENARILNEYLYSLGSNLFVKLILKIKHNNVIDLINKLPEKGSYQRPFKKENRLVSENHTFDQIRKIINASLDMNGCAIYNYLEKEYKIINFVEINTPNLGQNELPFVDKDNNFLIYTNDQKFILLITEKHEIHKKLNQRRSKILKIYNRVTSRKINT